MLSVSTWRAATSASRRSTRARPTPRSSTACPGTGTASRCTSPRTWPSSSGAPGTHPWTRTWPTSCSVRARLLAGEGAHEPEELVARLRVAAEAPEQARGHGGRVLLLHAAHHHAEVRGVCHDAHALRGQDGLERLGDLLGETLLDLEAPREDVDDARDLREPDDAPVGDVGDVHAPVEGQQVVLAQAV